MAINWSSTKEDDQIISEIVNRASNILEIGITDKMSLSMDITAVHLNDTNLDLKKLLAFDEFNFVHDVVGIMNHINRNNGKLTNCFLPRCSTN